MVEVNQILSLKTPIINGSGTVLPNYLDTIQYDPSKTNYALYLQSNDTIVHNRFIVPDWGSLRLDLHVPVPAAQNDQNSYVDISLITSDGQEHPLNSKDWNTDTRTKGRTNFDTKKVPKGSPEDNNPALPAVDLREVSPYADNAIRMETQANRIGYGRFGFETFEVDVPDELRGKVATLKIHVNGSTPIYLDDVFFKSEDLKFGNPQMSIDPNNSNGNVKQEARQDAVNQPNNYLLEKPQYTLSYNETDKTANWVSYKLDSSSINDSIGKLQSFAPDFNLPKALTVINQDKLKNAYRDNNGIDGYTKGHIVNAEDRSRSVQSYYQVNGENYSIKKDYK
ncbi:MAG: DNA/RNA non-specific endonuclease [Nostoc sp.]|uniref:DNA/RNA non-specific endonuclease n=1 Tax=Nostoc sp. TaxID=1180 RepID=UPI002FF852B7